MRTHNKENRKIEEERLIFLLIEIDRDEQTIVIGISIVYIEEKKERFVLSLISSFVFSRIVMRVDSMQELLYLSRRKSHWIRRQLTSSG